MSDIGVLALRLVVGLYLIGHGGQKMFGWFDGPGLRGASGMFTMLGFRPAAFWAIVAAGGELAGGLLLVLGFLNPLGELAIAASMAVATLAVHGSKGPWALKGGYELPLTDFVVVVALGLIGPGRYSLDALLSTNLPPILDGLLIVLTVLAVVVALVTRRPQAAPVVAGAQRNQTE